MSSKTPQDQPKPPNNDDLLDAIVAIASNPTRETYKAFYNELLKSQLILVADPDASPQPILLVSESDEVIMPVFTDFQRVKSTFSDANGYSIQPLPILCRMALSHEIYLININPENGPGCILQLDEILALAQNEIPEISIEGRSDWDEPTLVPFGDRKLPSEEEIGKMIEVAKPLLAQQDNLLAAYLILLGSGNNDSELTVALEFDTRTTDREKTSFTRKFIPELESKIGRQMRATWIDGQQLIAVKAKVTPFYQRE